MTHFTFNAVTIWLLLGIVAAVVEVLSPLFGFIFVTVAAFLAALLALAGMSVSVQLLVFAAALLLLLAVVRPRVVARIAPARGVPGRTDELMGQRGRVVEAVDPVLGTGRVIVAGHDWAARSSHVIPIGADVIIRGADGIILQVEMVA